MSKSSLLTLGAFALAVCLGACSPSAPSTTGTTGSTAPSTGSTLTGSITVDGSSTVYPIAAAFGEEFAASTNGGVKMSVSQAGTGAGMKKFVAGELDIVTASRPITADEMKTAETNGVEFIEVPIAFDGISIVVSKENTWLNSITVDQLKKLWNKDSKIAMWNEIDPAWPAEKISLYGPTSAHGSYEYFNEVINGDKKDSRQDYSQQPEYNGLVQGVAGEKGSLGYVGFSYVEENLDKLKLVPVDGGKGAITPSVETISNGTYAPLSRPLFLYVTKKAAARPEVQGFFEFILMKGSDVVKTQKFVPLPANLYEAALERFNEHKTGSVLGDFKPGMNMEELLKK